MVVVRTDLGTTRESARRLRFEPAVTMSATNVQKAIEEVEADAAAALQPLTTPTVVTATGNVAVTDVVVQTNQIAAIVLTLPNSVTWATQNSKYGLPLSVFDISGNASTNNVTFNTTGGQTISGLASGALKITTDYGGFRFEPKSGGGWVVV